MQDSDFFHSSIAVDAESRISFAVSIDLVLRTTGIFVDGLFLAMLLCKVTKILEHTVNKLTYVNTTPNKSIINVNMKREGSVHQKAGLAGLSRGLL